ncbi:terpenoid synthase [Peniophora sp. CONT]|nr:terpenoid synthase [Peniophora sp. CONT]
MADKYEKLLDTLLRSSALTTGRNDTALLEPFAYLTDMPGKDIRGAMISAFNSWLNVPEEKLRTIRRMVGMLHNASLLIDDIEDDSQLRRGQPVAHKIYGVPQTINCANYVYFLAYRELFSLRSPSGRRTPDGPQPPNRLYSDADLDMIVTDELLNLHRGQGQELMWRDSLNCPTEEEYLTMVSNKTGGLFRVAVKLMMACATANATVDYVPLVDLMGVLFQIRDDYMNLQADEYTTNKGFAEDLTEGKFSFPIVHGVRHNPGDHQLLNILQKRPSTPTLKTHAIRYLREKTRSFDYTLNVLRVIEKQTRAELVRLGGNSKLEAILDMLQVRQSTSTEA